MSRVRTFTTSPFELTAKSFYPRNYHPNYLYVKNKLVNCESIGDFISEPIRGGSTPPAYLFQKDESLGIPFVKTSAILRHFINVNDLHYIHPAYHNKSIKRSITKPYDVIYSMTGKFMGKAALCPPTITEMNMSQNSVLLRTDSKEKSAFLTIFLNSEINQIQVKGTYSITKQKFINQGKISELKIAPYDKKYDKLLADYIKNIDKYYFAIQKTQQIIKKFNEDFNLKFSNDSISGFSVSPHLITNKMLVPNYYRPDVVTTNEVFSLKNDCQSFNRSSLIKGDEIGSENYAEIGIPFVKTSDITNYDVDYETNWRCSEAYINELAQDLKKGDILFTKDGKPGEIAVIQENANIVISSGLVRYRAKNEDEAIFVFLLLSSKYGMANFKKWFVIASTMTHLRKDFFDEFAIPPISDTILQSYIVPLKKAFDEKEISVKELFRIRDIIAESFTSPEIVTQ